MRDCTSKPFLRHYDLERHFVTVHKKKTEELYCDYERCPHKESFRKDHCREHYREYHIEDLIKRGKPKPKSSKVKRNQKKPETLDEFLAARINNINLSWWRCSKCMQRGKVSADGYVCPNPDCKAACEPERVACRENARKLGNPAQAAGSTLGASSAPSSSFKACGKCENTWIPDKIDPKLWVSCPRCRPGVKETTRF